MPRRAAGFEPTVSYRSTKRACDPLGSAISDYPGFQTRVRLVSSAGIEPARPQGTLAPQASLST